MQLDTFTFYDRLKILSIVFGTLMFLYSMVRVSVIRGVSKKIVRRDYPRTFMIFRGIPAVGIYRILLTTAYD